jgi:hypothetical protein
MMFGLFLCGFFLAVCVWVRVMAVEDRTQDWRGEAGSKGQR